MRTARGELRRVAALYTRHAASLWLSFGLLLVASAIPAALVWLVRVLLDRVLQTPDAPKLWLVPVGIVGLYTLKGIVAVGRGLLTRSVGWRVVADVRAALFAHLLRLDLGWHRRRARGVVLSGLLEDTQELQYGTSVFATLVEKPLALVVLGATVFGMDPVLAAAGVVVLPAIALPVAWIGRRQRAAVEANLESRGTLLAWASQALTGLATIQAYKGERAQNDGFGRVNEAQRQQQMRTFLAQLTGSPVVELVAASGVALVTWVGGMRVVAGQITVGELLAFLVALGLLNEPLKALAQVHAQIERLRAAAGRVFAVLDETPAIRDTGTRALPPGPLAVALRGVVVDHGEGEVVRGVDLEVAPGSLTVLVGPSGAGKSTLVALIPRLLEATAGTVEVGGIDVRELPLDALRGAVTVVTQEPFLLAGTIRDNIAFGTGASQAAVEEAARNAHAHTFITALPKGYDTDVAEAGARLSGGERQRVCLARAFLRDTPILVLDEATSALDGPSEAAVQDALERLVVGRTVVAVAHRLSTIARADRVVVMDAGRIVEEGPPDQLRSRGGPYAALIAPQTRHL